MESPLSRRRLLHVSTAVCVPVSGCVDRGVNGQPADIPLEIANESDGTQTPFVEFAEQDTGDVLLSETSEIEAGTTLEFEVGPIDSQAQYTVSCELRGTTEDDTIPGSGLRSVQIEITETESVEINYTMT
jgi:hypothetical protein